MAFEVIEKLPSVTPIHRDRTVQDFVDKCRECGREKVLDKIRAEIEKDSFTDVNNSKFISVNRVNQIIDKYKAESEDKV